MSKYRALVSIPEFGKDAVCVDWAKPGLLAWKSAVEAKGGKLKANSLTRTCEQQNVLRAKYVAWLNAGKPSPAVAAANKPGRSGHQAGFSIDAQTVGAFPSAPANKQVDLLWETGKPHGFTPIIASPDESLSEKWHFDQWGDWKSVKDHMGYETTCLCGALDVGQAGEWQSDERLVQALLLRLGYDIGEPDGILGKRSVAALATLKLPFVKGASLEPTIIALRAMPASSVWKKVTA